MGDWREVRRAGAAEISHFIGEIERLDTEAASPDDVEDLVLSWTPPVGISQRDIERVEAAVHKCANVRDVAAAALDENDEFFLAKGEVGLVVDAEALCSRLTAALRIGGNALKEASRSLVRLDATGVEQARVHARTFIVHTLAQRIFEEEGPSHEDKETLLRALLSNPSSIVRASALQALFLYFPDSTPVDDALAESLAWISQSDDDVAKDAFDFPGHARGLSDFTGTLATVAGASTHEQNSHLFFLAALTELSQEDPTSAPLWSLLARKIKGAQATAKLSSGFSEDSFLIDERAARAHTLLGKHSADEVYLSTPSRNHSMGVDIVPAGPDHVDLVLYNRGLGSRGNYAGQAIRPETHKRPSALIFAGVARHSLNAGFLSELLTPTTKPSELYEFLSGFGEPRPGPTLQTPQNKAGNCPVSTLLAMVANTLDRQGAPKSAYAQFRETLYGGRYTAIVEGTATRETDIDPEYSSRLLMKWGAAQERLTQMTADLAPKF